MKRLNRVIEGLTTVSFGLILLANSAGVLSWRVWLTLFSLWPLLLIAIGVEIVGKGAKQDWLRVLSSLIVLGGLAWVVFVAPVAGCGWGCRGMRTPLDTASRIRRRAVSQTRRSTSRCH